METLGKMMAVETHWMDPRQSTHHDEEHDESARRLEVEQRHDPHSTTGLSLVVSRGSSFVSRGGLS